jgi:hypothetical protein
MLRVFLDTNIVRNSQHAHTEWYEETQSVLWGDREFKVPMLTSRETKPIEKFRRHDKNRIAYRDAKNIRYIEKLAKIRLIKLFWDFELQWEFISGRKMSKGTPSIVKYIENGHSPITYGRTITSAFSSEDHQFEFLKNLKHPRYDEWKKAANVVTNSHKERNQLLDAFCLWKAEHNKCDYFATMDYNLIDSVNASSIKSSLRLLRPTQLVMGALPTIPAVVCEKAGTWLTRRLIG